MNTLPFHVNEYSVFEMDVNLIHLYFLFLGDLLFLLDQSIPLIWNLLQDIFHYDTWIT